MDIYRKELNQIYSSQRLDLESLGQADIDVAIRSAEIIATIGKGSTVITDASCDRCYIFGGNLGKVMGFFEHENEYLEESSSDEDIIYSLIHPEDLVDKRLLEYEFFKLVDKADGDEKLSYKAMCRIRMRDESGNYLAIENSTQVIKLSPGGKIWLILCCYNLSSTEYREHTISPVILNTTTGHIINLSFNSTRSQILSKREKEILSLIQEGLPSKLVADRLNISVHTVNRHRQNIISKLSVTNSYEAIAAAKAMRLLE